MCPDVVEAGEGVGRGGGGGGEKGGAVHFEASHAGEDFLRALAGERELVVGEEKLVSGEGGGVALLSEVGGVAVEQGVEVRGGGRGGAGGGDPGGIWCCGFDPEALFGEGIEREA